MRTRKCVLLLCALVILVESMSGNRLHQNREQDAYPKQQIQPTSSQEQAVSNVFAQSVTGCFVHSHQGYLLKTEGEIYSIETDEDLSHFVNQQVKLTGLLQLPSAVPASGNTKSKTNLRFLMITSVIGSCYPPQQGLEK